ncbi:MAG: hypothetical protein SCAL_000474 [Candidatus Syntrophoarchaeum caldarius]|uniref:Uncharacterized protein n=1 Tax=Candidatus Syntropharchaeum caldarium TaxID=1838285 RepID=A0A1F2PC30_9EURY|nr:MAG: hypothetical protein SCAL_000474 [Candidatus Syntrophoarchaeum caldarius]
MIKASMYVLLNEQAVSIIELESGCKILRKYWDPISKKG